MAEEELRRATVSVESLEKVVGLLSRGNPVDRESLKTMLGPQPGLIGSLIDLSTTMTRWRQKDQERSALLESASELIQVRDSERLLQKLVERARSLIGCDIAYLSEYDLHTDELNVRASRGAISIALRKLRVPPGIGLAGRVIRDRTAHWTSNYDLAPLLHESRVDSAVKAERMMSLLGVPMIVDGEVLGALFAASRYAHDFSADEITLLSALADHASIVLKTARLMGELAQAAQASANAEALAATKAYNLQRLVDVEEQLTRLVLRGEGIPAVTKLVAETLDADVFTVDSPLLDSPNDPQENTALSRHGVSHSDVSSALETSRSSGRTAQVSNSPRTIVASVASNKRLYSGLIVHFRTIPEEVDRNIVARAAQTLALVYMQEQATADAESRARGELAVDLIAGTRSLDELKARGRPGGFNLSGSWRVITIQNPGDEYNRIASYLTRTEPRILLTQRSPGLTVLLPASVHHSCPGVPGLLLGAEVLHHCLLVSSDAEVERAQLRATEDELWACIRVLNSLSITVGMHSAADFAPYTAMFGTAPGQVERFVERMLGPLQHWDHHQSADLVNTLRTYFDHRGNISRTASALSVHINTVKQRLDRIDSVLDIDWRAPEYAFRIQVALRLNHLQQID